MFFILEFQINLYFQQIHITSIINSSKFEFLHGFLFCLFFFFWFWWVLKSSSLQIFCWPRLFIQFICYRIRSLTSSWYIIALRRIHFFQVFVIDLILLWFGVTFVIWVFQAFVVYKYSWCTCCRLVWNMNWIGRTSKWY